ncbi:MAG: molybdopterin molybdotransferase MoeA, partial [Nitratireductor sp.]|nr:molybdopterin molybdotransferase MoeA [Nitratireductor sp.]
MRTDLVPAEEALAIILGDAGPGASETVPLSRAGGRVLASDLAARRTQPPFAASAMDGYAVRAADVQSVPANLRLVGEAAAGHPFGGEVGEGETARIFTGAPVPAGADAIVIQENVSAKGATITILQSSSVGRHIRPEGLDFATGDVLLQRGDLIDPQRLSLAAAMNHASLPVYRKPRVALFATGDELALPGEETGAGGIIASNTFGLAAMVASSGGEVDDLGIVRDTRAALERALKQAIDGGADLILTTGGASVGDHDLIAPALKALGAEIRFSKIALRPGKPLIFASLQTGGRVIRALGLAGNPVSSIVAGYRFVVPLVTKLAGLPMQRAAPLDAVFGCELPANDEREEYMRATVRRREDGTLEATPFPRQDSSMLANLARADALVIRAAH